MKTKFAPISLILSLALTITPAAIAFADTESESSNDVISSEIYLPDDYREPGITPFTRGQCTDVYPKAWCDSHGYANNRPVGGQVKLTHKEEKCYLDLLAQGSEMAIMSLVTGSTGAFYAAPWVAFQFWNCLF